MEEGPEVSGIFTVRNGLEAGYPFVEACLSALPLVDELLINDGGSDDGTLEILQQLEQMYPEKIKIFNMKDKKSEDWETIDRQLEFLMYKATGDWVLEVQADEIWHEEDIEDLKEVIRKADEKGCNSIRQPRITSLVDRMCFDGYRYWTVRILRNLSEVKSNWGGDDFQLENKERNPPKDYTTHTLPPEYETDIPLYHLRSFPGHRKEYLERHAKWLATESENRQEILENYEEDK